MYLTENRKEVVRTKREFNSKLRELLSNGYTQVYRFHNEYAYRNINSVVVLIQNWKRGE